MVGRCELSTRTRKGSFGMLLSQKYWRSTLFISGFWFCAVTPYFTIATFADSALNQYGLAGGVGLPAVALAGVVVTFLLIDKAGRRVLTVPPQTSGESEPVSRPLSVVSVLASASS